MAGVASIKVLMLLVIVDIFALSMTGTVANAVVSADANTNITGAAQTMLPFVTLLYVLCIIGANIGVLYRMFKTS